MASSSLTARPALQKLLRDDPKAYEEKIRASVREQLGL
jgi:hypothetical protein